ncbi:MAG TPA: AVAST type 3 anti-phage protein Avs3b [Acidobacteriaceae bacterium]
MDTSLPTADSTSSTPKEIGQRSDAIIKLGEKLLEELNSDRVDTLGRWMAHSIAELIAEAENAPTSDKKQLKVACAEEILKIWAHRQQLPGGFRPFNDFEPVMRTLQSLDLDPQFPRYFDRLIAHEDSEEEGTEARKWQKIAVGVDSAAKILIRVCLAAAVAKAVDRNRPWIALAESITEENNNDISTIRFLLDNADLVSAKDPKERDRQQLKEALEKLDGFESLVKILRKDLKSKLRHLSKGDVPTKEQC